MSKRIAARTSVTPEAATLIRKAFEPRYGRTLDDSAVDGIADRFRRFTDVLVSWETEDRARALLEPADLKAPASPPLRTPPVRSK